MYNRRLFYLIYVVLVLSISGPVQALEFSDDFNTPHDYVVDGVAGTGWDGMIGLGPGETVDVLQADIDHPNELYIQSTGSRWEPPWSPLGPYLYREVTGDFIATVHVTDFAGCPPPHVLHNECSLMARAGQLDAAGAGEDFVSIVYFPTWVGNMGKSFDDGNETEFGLTYPADRCADTDPYLQLERVGNIFYFRHSPDGENWTELEGSPIARNDLNGLPLQVGLAHATYSGNTGWAAFDDFSLSYVEIPPLIYYVNAVDGNDNNDGLTPETAFATIQKGIDETQDGDTVVVQPGTYTGDGNRDIDFLGKAITVRSTDPNDPNVVATTIIDCEDSGRGFKFHSGEGPNSVVCGFTITNGYLDNGHGGGIYCNGASPTITNNVITNNTALSMTITPSSVGGGICCINSSAIIMNNLIAGNYVRGVGGGIFSDSASIINNTITNNYSFSANFESSVGGIYCTGSSSVVNTIIWDNFGYFSPKQMYGCTNVTYSNIQDGYEGEGNIDTDPCFVRLGYWEYIEPNLIFHEGDYHLLSQRGRYWPEHDVWVLDDVTSPCIDGGDPNVNPSNEPMPNGGRINMGAYGNTAYASMSEWPIKGDINYDGIVNMIDLAILAEDWLKTPPWEE